MRALLTGSGPAENTPDGKRRAELRAQLDKLRSEQAGSKGSRLKVLDEVKALQEEINKKTNDLRAETKKLTFKTAAEVDEEIKRQEKLIESGTLRLVEERQTLGRVMALKKTRKQVAELEKTQSGVNERKEQLEKLRGELKTLEADPAVKAASEKYSKIKAELDQIQARFAESAKDRSKLVAQQNTLQKKLDALFERKRSRYAAFRDVRDAFDKKRDDERRKRIEQEKQERKAHEVAKRQAKEAELREQAAIPAFTKEIENCDVLINYFSGGKHKAPSAVPAAATPPLGKEKPVRAVEDTAAPAGAKVLTKGKEEDAFYIAKAPKKNKNKKKGKKPTVAAAEDGEESGASTPNQGDKLHVPIGTLSALLALSIPPPSSSADVARVVENLERKRQYFVANQAHQTETNKANVEKLIAKNHGRENGESPSPEKEAAPAPTDEAAEVAEATEA